MQEYVYTNKDGRTRLVIVDDNGKHTSKSYPRILMEQKLGRPLEPYEDVHHIDGDKTNNNINNLEIKLHGEHQKEHSQKYKDTVEKCQICGQEFTMTAKRWATFFSNRSRKKVTNVFLTCSRSCAGKASHHNVYQLLYDVEDRLAELYGNQEQ